MAIFVLVDIRDVITCFKFGDDRFTDLTLRSDEGHVLPFPIDLGYHRA